MELGLPELIKDILEINTRFRMLFIQWIPLNVCFRITVIGPVCPHRKQVSEESLDSDSESSIILPGTVVLA